MVHLFTAQERWSQGRAFCQRFLRTPPAWDRVWRPSEVPSVGLDAFQVTPSIHCAELFQYYIPLLAHTLRLQSVTHLSDPRFYCNTRKESLAQDDASKKEVNTPMTDVKLAVGDAVLISGLTARPELNGSTGSLVRYFDNAGRWAVILHNQVADPIKLKPINLRRAFLQAAVAPRPRGAEMLHSELARSLATQNFAVVDDFLSAEDSAAFCALMAEQRATLEMGEIAGGRAAAAYHRILKRPPPRGDLMKFLTETEASELAPLQPVLKALDAAVAALVRAPELLEEWSESRLDPAASNALDGSLPGSVVDTAMLEGNEVAAIDINDTQAAQCEPTEPTASLGSTCLAASAVEFPVILRREEMQVTCYPGDGARYVKHVDNNDGRQTGRKITCIVYANPDWKASDGGELRLHVPVPRAEAKTAGSTEVHFHEPETGGANSNIALGVDVSPKANRLVLFWSDARVPHEVRPALAPRYALSIWYHLHHPSTN